MRLLTRNQFMKEFNIGYDKMQKMIAAKEVDFLPEADRIRIDEKTVTIDLFNEERRKRIEAETKIEMLKSILI